MNLTTNLKFRRCLTLASILLMILGSVYAVHGIKTLLVYGGGDYRMRWVEEQYVFRGKNPMDIYETAQAEAQNRPALNSGRDTMIDLDLGPTYAGYPPWAYFTGVVFTWPSSFVLARKIYASCNILLLLYLLAWAYRIGHRRDNLLGLCLAASLLAVNSISTSLVVGQYCVVVLAALAAAYSFDEDDNWIVSGLCLGIALTKITLTGPFVLPFLIKRRWRTLLVTGAYLAVGSVVIWIATKTNPLEMLKQMLHASDSFAGAGYALNNLFQAFGVGTEPATKLAAAVGVLAALIILYFKRHSSMLTLFAVAALVARAWSYHRFYDDLIVSFVLIAIVVITWDRKSLLGLISALLLGLGLWIHQPFWMQSDLLLLLQWGLWTQGLIVLLWIDRGSSVTDPIEHAHLAKHVA